MGTIRTRNRRVTKDTLSISTLVMIVVLNVCQLSRGNPVFVDNPSLAQFQSGRNIRHLPCIVRKSGMSGVCMFAIDCIKQNGTHLGTCIDRFYFGSCCQMKDDSKIFAEEISDNSIDQNTISHFSHETSTLSTSSVFKLPTESYIDSLGIRNHSTIHPYIPVSTITHMAAKVESTTTRFITSRPTTTTTTTSTTTTTTPAPTPTTRRTSVDPPRRRTTTAVPLLTKAPETTFDDIFDSTTIPTKFTTFQMVETSTPSRTTEAAVHEETTTFRRPISTRRPTTAPTRTKKPLITRIPAANFTVPPTTTRPTSRTTPKYKPTQSRRPTTTTTTTAPTTTTTHKPTKRPIVIPTTTATRTRPTRKPTPQPEAVNVTTSTPTRQDPTTSTSTLKPNVTTETTTRAPRPRPKPTAEIFKITKPPVTVETTTLKLEPPMTTVPTSTSTPKPSPTTTTTTTTTTPVPTTTTTTTTTQRTTTSRKPIRRPTTTPTTSTTKTTSTTTTTTTTPAPTTTTTTTTQKPTTTPTTTTTIPTTTPTARPTPEKTPTTEFILDATSTYRPTLVTWTTVVDNKPNKTAEETDWQPKPPPAGWVPVPTIDPEVVANKTTTEASSTPLGPTTEGLASLSSSEAEKVDSTESTTTSLLPFNATSSTPLSTSSTEGPPTTAAPATTSPSPIATSTTIVTEISSESLPDTSTLEPSTIPEELNATTAAPFTTSSPIPSLEGVDYRQVCGRRMFPEPRIVGGSNAAFGRWPWQISLRQWRTSTYLHKCGAALLNENWAITAAHCVDNVPPSDLLLRLGEYDLAEEEEPYGYQERRVQIVASHPQFDPRTFEYDLALLRFYEPVVFQPNIIPVCVPGSDEDFIGQTAFVTGWGRLYEDGPLPSVLQEVAVPIINNTICETMYRAAGYIEHIPHIFICAGWKKGGYDSCEGDSGGPMVLQREADKRFILGGVISWGIGCAEPNQPGVYTRISEFRDWVNQILQF